MKQTVTKDGAVPTTTLNIPMPPGAKPPPPAPSQADTKKSSSGE